ncbi:MAG: hypothetical protein NTY15_06755 [Planctomycetota bacterium]|nr:hypothetical protein [Planctomycetota bacterium]
MKDSRNPRLRRNSGHTIAECLMAFAMLVPIAILVTKVALQTEQASRDSALASHGLRELMNAREEIGSWEYSRVSFESIQSIPILESPEFGPLSRSLQAVIEEVEAPIASKRVSLSLHWSNNGQDNTMEVGPITFWIIKP